VNGIDVGSINLTGELVRLQMKKNNVREDNVEMKKIVRRATEADINKMKETKLRERDVMIRSRAIAKQLKLEMKVAEVEIQADGRKATFFYIADDRVDFRELIKVYASEFKVKVEMKQIGARQEAGKVGGIGSCGRELCCSTWLTDFKSVNTNAARYQNLSINQTKLSGQCGRLKCCLNFELDTYLDALQNFPDDCDVIEISRSRAFLVKKDIFRNLMWYSLPDTTKQYPLTIERVRKIKALNMQGIRPDELEAVEVVSKKQVEVEPVYADVVGQISLRSLEKTSRRRREQEKGPNKGGNRPNNENRGGQPQRQGSPEGNRPQQQGGGNQPQNRPQQQRPQQANPRQQDGPRQQQGGNQGQRPNQPQRGNGGPQQQRPQQNRPQQQRPPQQPRGEQQPRPPKQDNNHPKS
jgi:cell fate regulator YaaT (PSP1 superfamily)